MLNFFQRVIAHAIEEHYESVVALRAWGRTPAARVEESCKPDRLDIGHLGRLRRAMFPPAHGRRVALPVAGRVRLSLALELQRIRQQPTMSVLASGPARPSRPR
jgi:hypothetical protein